MSLKDHCALGRCAEADASKLKACSACSEVWYCCKEHQVEHYHEGGHKLICVGRKKGSPVPLNECMSRVVTLVNQEKWSEALPYYGALLEFAEKNMGSNHSHTVNILNTMVMCYKRLKRYEEVEQCLQRTLGIHEQSSDEHQQKSHLIFQTTGQLGEAYMASGKLPKAKEILYRVRDMAEQIFGADSFEAGKSLSALSTCLDKCDETEEAISTLVQGLNIPAYGNATMRQERLTAAVSYSNLGVLYLKVGKRDEAFQQYRKSFELKIKGGLPASHPEIQNLKAILSAGKQLETLNEPGGP
ncbi:tetratricopeptide repeat protein [archaeon]|nr:MAG: tetratricopeptide repeat protein [archaeon]